MKISLAPAGSGQALGLLGQQRCAGGDHEDVVGDALAAVQVDRARRGIDVLDLGEAELDAVVQLRAARADDLGRIGQAEGDEQQTGLVDVAVVAVDDDDLDRRRRTARRSRFAVSVPPVPAPRMTMRRAMLRVSRAGGQGSSGIRPGGGVGLPHDDCVSVLLISCRVVIVKMHDPITTLR